ncbi:MAG TPA: hypothetical protein VGI66_03370 [Streptosporangiaceae bacterium]|jgi:hypothetical protein
MSLDDARKAQLSGSRGLVGETEKLLYGPSGRPGKPLGQKVGTGLAVLLATAVVAAAGFALALGCFELWKVVVH